MITNWLQPSVIRWTLVVFAVIVAAAAFFIPDTPGSNGVWIYLFEIGRVPADFRQMADRSVHPLALAVSLSLAMALGGIAAVLTTVTRINLSPLHRLIDNRNLTQRIITVMLCVLLIAAPLFVEQVMPQEYFATSFFQRVLLNRLWLALWVEMIFSLSYICWFWVLFELRNAIKGVRNGIQNT